MGDRLYMKKIDETIKRETLYIAVIVIILSVLLQAIFLVIGKWNYTVILGNLLSGVFAVLNFFLMGLSVQAAVGKDEKDAKTTIKASQSMRMFMLFCVAAVGVLLPCFHTLAVLIPLLFPRIAIALRPLFAKKLEKEGE